MIRVFVDFEFTHLGSAAQPISVGCVTDRNERAFYAEFTDYNPKLVSAFTDQFVLPTLKFGNHDNGPVLMGIPGLLGFKGTQKEVGNLLNTWLHDLWMSCNGRFWEGETQKIQVWGDVVSYDWAMFTDVLTDRDRILPSWLSYIPMDIAVLFEVAGLDPDISRAEFMGVPPTNHDALQDAALACICHGELMKMLTKGAQV